MNKSAAQTTPSVSTGCVKSKPKTQHEKEIALFKVAAVWEGETKKSIIEALRAKGLAGSAANVERVQTLRHEFGANRALRQLNYANARVTEHIESFPLPSGRPAIQLPEGAPAQRLVNLRKSVITKLAKECFRYGAPGGTGFTIKFASTTAEVRYSVELGRNYDVYRGAYKGWGANVDCHTICIPLDWRIRVQRKGLAQLGGMLTLDAHPMEAPAGISLYAAVWASQGRGYDVKTERGYIAVSGAENFHGETVEEAVSGLLKKCTVLKANMELMADFALSVDAFIAKYSDYKIDVSLDDARKSGSCEFGIRSWCESIGVDVNRIRIPMAELLEGFQKMPLSEVRRAVLYSVRKIRRHR